MIYHSTKDYNVTASIREAVLHGYAPDGGQYLPEKIPTLPKAFMMNLGDMTLQEVSYAIANYALQGDIDAQVLHDVVFETLNFPIPLIEMGDNRHILELFHGPTMSFKDIGTRFMARLLGHFIRRSGSDELVNVLVATSGDTGSAVANGFLGVPGIHVYVLYPKGKVSPIQECQFTTLGQNITALEVDGVFDDCQALVKSAFMDAELSAHMRLTSANSINVARFLPQSFYYFYACAQLQRRGWQGKTVACVPSGNFGNMCSALIGKRMGLPVHRFIAANNANDVFYKYLQTGEYAPMASLQTIANAMDVGDPSNFARILDLYGHSVEAIRKDISGATYSDAQIASTLRSCLHETGYQLDPHGACGYRALQEGLGEDEVGFFLETAHPAKFKSVVEDITGQSVAIPPRLAAFMKGEKQSVPMSRDFQDFKAFLMAQ